MAILTADCRFTGLKHEDCVGRIYLGSILSDPSNCECGCHKGGSIREPSITPMWEAMDCPDVTDDPFYDQPSQLCNCDPGDAYGHHVWCDMYRPEGMSDAKWEESIKAHPLLTDGKAL